MRKYLVGIISDTHGMMRPEALAALRGTELIIHAGDVGKPHVLDALGQIAEVLAIRGNVDTGEWAAQLPKTRAISIGEVRIHLLHNIKKLTRDAAADGYKAVIFGHSHQPTIQKRNGVLFINPGSAGPRRFKLPVSIAFLRIEGIELDAQLFRLPV